MSETVKSREPGAGLSCLRCNVPLEQIHYETWKAPILTSLVKPVQNFAYKSGVRIWYCPKCRKIEFYK